MINIYVRFKEKRSMMKFPASHLKDTRMNIVMDHFLQNYSSHLSGAANELICYISTTYLFVSSQQAEFSDYLYISF